MTTKKDTEQVIEGQSPQPSNYTRIPNNAIYELDIYEYKLLGVLMHLHFKGKQQVPNKTIASMVGCSVSKMKDARQDLADNGYINYTKGTIDTLSKVEILYDDIWENNSQGGYQEKTPPLPQDDTYKDTTKKTKALKDSFAEKSAKDIEPDTSNSDAKKKEDSLPKPDVPANPQWFWETRILDTLTDDWMAASAFEEILDISFRTIDPLEFSEHPAVIALYALEAERKVEYQAIDGNRREWRLHPDGQPSPKSDFDLLKLAIARCLNIHNGALDFMTHMLRGTAKTGIWGEEAQYFKDNPVSAAELENMVDYWVSRHPDIDKPSKPRTVSSEMTGYRLYAIESQANAAPELNFEVHDEPVAGSLEDMQAKHFGLFMQSQEESEDE